MSDSAMTVNNVSLWHEKYPSGRWIRCLFALVPLLFCTDATAEQVNRQRVAICPTNQLIHAKEIWGEFASNDEATDFARRKFLALGEEGFANWLSCQRFDVRVSSGRGATTNIHATYITRHGDEDLWVPQGVYYWLFPPRNYYIEVHVKNRRLIDITATAISE
ncbi:hypothetical protein C1D09_031625 [Mesorhizobium intechi]|uniref:Uncharacterized protein n=1 Tax=Mesorhizobium intechi TaxID=537601 RepID=A0A8T9AHW0_9HYPH|nr:hypothetical protein [Mesorhizobium intechi]TSE00925.1 hypothetical protein C1D09_031625 [Mesorhizobium intechi]